MTDVPALDPTPKWVGSVVRTVTCTVTQGANVATGEVVDPAVLAQRVGWLAALVAEVGQSVLDARWDRESIDVVCADVFPGGTPMNSRAWMAVATLFGHPALPAGVHASSRVKRMAGELAGRQLRSAAYRLGVVDQLLAGVDPTDAGDPVTGRNTRRQIGKHLDTTGVLPADLFTLAPTAPRLPAQVPLAASDAQFHQLDTTHLADGVLWVTLDLPTCARPAGKKDWGAVRLRVPVPEHYLPACTAGRVTPPTLRVVAGRVRADLPVKYPRVPWLPDTGHVLGVDWGVNRLLTAALVSTVDGLPSVKGDDRMPCVDGRPLFFDPTPLLRKARLLTVQRQHLRGKVDRLNNLLAGRPNPALAVKTEVLRKEIARVNRKQVALNDQIARLAAAWTVGQALAAGCHAIALEDLTTLEHRDKGAWNNTRISGALRGQVRTAIEEAAALVGLRVITVHASGTSMFCPRCDTRLEHLTAPNGVKGYAWARCLACPWQGGRDQGAAEKVGQRALAPKARRVRKRATRKTELVPARRERPRRARRDKVGPTMKRGVSRTRTQRLLPPSVLKASRRSTSSISSSVTRSGLHGQVTPPKRSVGPSIQGLTQVWNTVTNASLVDGLRCAYRHTVTATPVKYRTPVSLAARSTQQSSSHQYTLPVRWCPIAPAPRDAAAGLGR